MFYPKDVEKKKAELRLNKVNEKTGSAYTKSAGARRKLERQIRNLNK